MRPPYRAASASEALSASHLLDRLRATIPLREKALFTARLHLAVMRHRMRVIVQSRESGEVVRGTEMFWVILGALIGHLENETVTQKSLAATVDGAFSAATISRAIRDARIRGWITVRADPRDIRSRAVFVTEKTIGRFTNETGIQSSWAYHLRALTPLQEFVRKNHANVSAVFDAWIDGLNRLPLASKTLVLCHLHQKAFERFVAIVLVHRQPGEFTRVYEIFWMFLETIVAALDGKPMTQKDLVANASGLYSDATISRVVQEGVDKGWIVATPAVFDARVRQLTPTDKVLADFYREEKVARSWRDYMSIFDGYMDDDFVPMSDAPVPLAR